MATIDVISAREMAEGEGARVKRLFPSPSMRNADPFVLLDEFFVPSDAGFPEHPHGGFEAITYMIEGSFRHQDSIGNNTEVGPGGAQHFSAGRGLTHSEMPGSYPMNHGLQLWVNLPRPLKKSEPVYQQVEPESIPETQSGGVTIRTIVGPNSPVAVQAHVVYRHVTLEKGVAYEFAPPQGYRGVVYLFRGNLDVERFSIHPGQAFNVRSEAIRGLASETTEFAEIYGVPLNEPIILRGSFVE